MGNFNKEEYKNNIVKIITSTKEEYDRLKLLIKSQRRICFLKTYITLDENFLFGKTSEYKKEKIQAINEIIAESLILAKWKDFQIKIIQNSLTENKLLWIKWI